MHGPAEGSATSGTGSPSRYRRLRAAVVGAEPANTPWAMPASIVWSQVSVTSSASSVDEPQLPLLAPRRRQWSTSLLRATVMSQPR